MVNRGDIGKLLTRFEPVDTPAFVSTSGTNLGVLASTIVYIAKKTKRRETNTVVFMVWFGLAIVKDSVIA